MLKSLDLENFTLFHNVHLEFGKNLNVIVGENGTGKSHLLKAAYVPIAVSAERHSAGGGDLYFSKEAFPLNIAQKFQTVFRPEGLWRLVTRQQGRSKCRLSYEFDPKELDMTFTFSTVERKTVKFLNFPKSRIEKRPVFLPTRELLSIYRGFVSLYETTHLEFPETWRDTCILLGAPLARGPRERTIKELLVPLEKAMGGSVLLQDDRFYLKLRTGKMEMHLVAEGLRKLATIAQLVATGSLLDKGYLFWDEPEANLNPRVIKTIARTILQLSASGIQVFIATHSLFLMRELHILQKREFPNLDTRCFGLHPTSKEGVKIQQGRTMDDVGDISALDEELQQSERYVDTEMGVPLTSSIKQPHK